jgi:hypothetical protein
MRLELATSAVTEGSSYRPLIVPRFLGMNVYLVGPTVRDLCAKIQSTQARFVVTKSERRTDNFPSLGSYSAI